MCLDEKSASCYPNSFSIVETGRNRRCGLIGNATKS